MKKALIVILVLICSTAGFLYYDWHVKTKKLAAEPDITMYSWTDEEGKKHYTDTQAPPNAKNVEEFKGYEHVEPPLIEKIKDKTIVFFKWVKGRLFKKKDKDTHSHKILLFCHFMRLSEIIKITDTTISKIT